MIRLSSKRLDTATKNHLAGQQRIVNGTRPFAAKCIKADSRWDSKKSSAAGVLCFNTIGTVLLSMCAGVQLCVYCENNEATDVEHIFPKKLYPEKSFVWANYVLACGNCNTRYKSDRFKVFMPSGSTTVINVTPPRGTYIKPPNGDALFINPRKEDPMDFMELDLRFGQYIFTISAATGTRDFERAEYTIDLLGLNKREPLRVARESAAKFYFNRFDKYVKLKHATTFQQIEDAFADDFNPVDTTKTVAFEKRRIRAVLKAEIINYHHPTVWKEMMRQRGILPRTNALLLLAPEALNWM